MSGISIDRVDWHPQRALEAVDHLARQTNERVGHRLLEDAQRRVPYDTGALADSAELVANDEGVAIGYTAEHAVFVHARGIALGGRDAHWLESAIEADAAELGGIYTESFRSGWPNG